MRNLHRWQKFYKAAGIGSMDKFHLCAYHQTSATLCCYGHSMWLQFYINQSVQPLCALFRSISRTRQVAKATQDNQITNEHAKIYILSRLERIARVSSNESVMANEDYRHEDSWSKKIVWHWIIHSIGDVRFKYIFISNYIKR